MELKHSSREAYTAALTFPGGICKGQLFTAGNLDDV